MQPCLVIWRSAARWKPVEGEQRPEVIKLLARLEHPERVEAVSLEMSGSFAPVVRQAQPQAALVIDQLHVMQRVCDPPFARW